MADERRRRSRPASGDYAVGYGKPPLNTRFQRGQSGNPRGRPQGRPTVGELLGKALAEKVAVKEGGRRRTITKAEAIATQLVNKAATGDLRAMRAVMQLERRPGPSADPQRATNPPIVTPDVPEIDFSALTTEQLQILWEAGEIVRQQPVAPPFLLPPGSETSQAAESGIRAHAVAVRGTPSLHGKDEPELTDRDAQPATRLGID